MGLARVMLHLSGTRKGRSQISVASYRQLHQESGTDHDMFFAPTIYGRIRKPSCMAGNIRAAVHIRSRSALHPAAAERLTAGCSRGQTTLARRASNPHGRPLTARAFPPADENAQARAAMGTGAEYRTVPGNWNSGFSPTFAIAPCARGAARRITKTRFEERLNDRTPALPRWKILPPGRQDRNNLAATGFAGSRFASDGNGQSNAQQNQRARC